MIGPALQTIESRKWCRRRVIELLALLIYNCIWSYSVGKRFNDDPRLTAQLSLSKITRMGASSNPATAVDCQNCPISMHAKLILAWSIGVERQKGRRLTCACLMCPAVPSYSGKILPDWVNLTLWRKKIS